MSNSASQPLTLTTSIDLGEKSPIPSKFQNLHNTSQEHTVQKQRKDINDLSKDKAIL